MPCSCCGFGALASSCRHVAASGTSVRAGVPPRCARCGAVLPTDEAAALYLDKLEALARFGLASDTRLLLEPSAGDA